MRLPLLIGVSLLLGGCQSSLSPDWAVGGDDDDGAIEEPYPLSVSVAPLAGGVRVSWSAVAGAQTYRVYVARETGVGPGADGLDGAQMVETASTTADVRGMPDTATRFVAVTAVALEDESGPSPEVSTAPMASGWAGGAPSTTPLWSVTGPGGTEYGSSLAGADFDRDGFADLLVGADDADDGPANSGSVYLYAGGPSGIATVASATFEGTQVDEEFGESIAIGDVDDDGWLDLAIAARDYDNGQTQEGRVALYTGAPGPWPAATPWSIETNEGSADLGLDVMAAGDFDGDGRGDVAIGASGYDGTAGTDAGRVYVVYAGTGPASPAILDGDYSPGRFGQTLAAGDVDGDGFDDLVVAQPEFDVSADQDQGKLFLFRGGAAGLEASPSASLQGPTASEFGSCLVAADVDGDGRVEMIATGWKIDGAAGANTGRAYVVKATNGTLVFGAWTFEPDDPNANLGEFGNSGGAADVNGDGFDDVILSAGEYDLGAVPTRAGAAFLFLGSPSGLEPSFAWDVYGTLTSADEIVVSRIGDANGDGGEEFAIGFPNKRIARVFEGTKATGPILAAPPPATTLSSAPLTLDATFADPGGAGHTCTWDFGDGATTGPAPCAPAPSHSYDAAGTYVARVRVTNAAGDSAETATTVTVQRFVLR